MDTRFYRLPNYNYALYQTNSINYISHNYNSSADLQVLTKYISMHFKVNENSIKLMDSGSSAILYIINMMKDIMAIDSVYIPSYFCLEVADAILTSKCKIKLYELNYNLMPTKAFIESLQKEQQSLLIFPSFFGKNYIDEEMLYLLSQLNIPIIFDEAQSFPMESTIFGYYLKYWFSIVSFGRSKPCSSVGGGAVISHNCSDEISIYLLKELKFIENDYNLEKKTSISFDTLEALINSRTIKEKYIVPISKIQAYSAYYRCLSFLEYKKSLSTLDAWYLLSIKDIKCIPNKNKPISEYSYFPIFVNSQERYNIMKIFGDLGIQCTFYYYPIHLNKKYCTSSHSSFSFSEKIFSSILILPLHQDLNTNKIYCMLSIIFDILKESEFHAEFLEC